MDSLSTELELWIAGSKRVMDELGVRIAESCSELDMLQPGRRQELKIAPAPWPASSRRPRCTATCGWRTFCSRTNGAPPASWPASIGVSWLLAALKHTGDMALAYVVHRLAEECVDDGDAGEGKREGGGEQLGCIACLGEVVGHVWRLLG